MQGLWVSTIMKVKHIEITHFKNPIELKYLNTYRLSYVRVAVNVSFYVGVVVSL